MIGGPDDIDRIMDVMMAAFDPAYGEAWNRRQVEDALALGNCRYGLVDSDGQQPQPGSQARYSTPTHWPKWPGNRGRRTWS